MESKIQQNQRCKFQYFSVVDVVVNVWKVLNRLKGILYVSQKLVDAKDALAAAFYKHHGLLELPIQSLELFLPPATVTGIAPLQ